MKTIAMGRLRLLIGLCAISCVPAFATVKIVSFRSSPRSAQTIGTPIHWTAKAIDSNANNLTFQFNVAPPGGSLALARDFNVGRHAKRTWRSPAFTWVPTGGEGVYRVQVVAKDFTSGETDTVTRSFTVTPLVTGDMPVAVASANPLVAYFSAPACPAGSAMRVSFQQVSLATPATTTNWVNCGATTMTFEIAGMYETTEYQMFAQTQTGGNIVNGPTVNFTTGKIPRDLAVPVFTATAPGPNADTTDSLMLHTLTKSGNKNYVPVATDLSGSVMWYYHSISRETMITRPLQPNAAFPIATFLSLENGKAWDPGAHLFQYLRQVDLAGNVIRETNTGVVQQELLALGNSDAQACNAIPRPPAIGAACFGDFHHDAIQTLPNGYTAVIGDIEKIFPPGTQEDKSSLPVDIVGDMLIVLNENWQVNWYFNAFDHAGGPPQLNINRRAVLGEICVPSNPCPFTYLLGTGIAPEGKDWLHANSIYYWPQNGDLVWSSRSQDWILRVDYNNGMGKGDILWRMGREGDFKFNNIYNDPWPWFSGQHEVGIEDLGAGPMSMMDNGTTRTADPPLGLGKGTGCEPSDCNSRGMMLTVDQTNRQVTPVMSVDLGVYAVVFGSAQLLDDGVFFFSPGNVEKKVGGASAGYAIQIFQTPNTATGTQELNMTGPKTYRTWEMPSMYAPPIT